jgi:two-component system sensor histidine kinase KdpD
VTTSQPTPESFLRLIHRSRRGRLKVYLGYGPGVGKTYQMLLEGQRLKAQGVDVVVGVVETHGRADTASLTLGLEMVPPREVVYHGVRLAEMDVAALLARRPEVVLVDELAHTNVPGSPNVKRWQDVQEILAAGVHVVTTLNVQHLESLYDTVERLIGVKVKERLPDWVLADADQIVNVDLATEDLQRRMEEGRIYPPERAKTALAHFFRKGNLDQLRELALREAAAVIERRGRSASEPAVHAPDQVVVCLSSKSPHAAALLRHGSRLAGRLNRNWYALYVQTAAEDPARLDPATHRRIADSLELASQLGATVFTFQGDDVVDTILRFAREYRVGHVVVGRPGPLPAWRRLRRNVVERLIAGAGGLTVVVVDPEAAAAMAGDKDAPAPAPRLPTAEVPEPAGPAAAAPPAPTLPAGKARLSDLLTPAAVVISPAPIARDALFRELITAAAAGEPDLDREDLLRRLALREREATTFLSEGVALPHLRVPGLVAPRAALALPRGGIEGAAAPVDAVFLFLCPDDRPNVCLDLLGAAARLFRDGRARAALRDAPDAKAALAVLERWEGGR